MRHLQRNALLVQAEAETRFTDDRSGFDKAPVPDSRTIADYDIVQDGCVVANRNIGPNDAIGPDRNIAANPGIGRYDGPRANPRQARCTGLLAKKPVYRTDKRQARIVRPDRRAAQTGAQFLRTEDQGTCQETHSLPRVRRGPLDENHALRFWRNE